MAIPSDPPSQQSDPHDQKKEGLKLSDTVSIVGVFFIVIMAWFAYQSLQSSNKSVEISNKALELSQRSIAASDIATARSYFEDQNLAK